ncbi:MAG: sugar transferase [Clostridium sp.]|nr:sugar transferase [Clostridium sp.]
MNKRSRIQSFLEFSSGLLALLLANVFCYILFTEFIPKILTYETKEWCSYVYYLLASFLFVFLCFYSKLNITQRSRPRELLSTLRNCVLTYVSLAVILLITKNEIVESRYLFISSFFTYFALNLLLRYVTKKYMLKKITNSSYATQTGVITTYDRAIDFIPTIKFDWSKNIKAIALADAVYDGSSYRCRSSAKSNNGSVITEQMEAVESIYDIPVVANKDNLMGWIRTASLDEVYINLTIDESEDFIEQIEELEDMGITVHVNIPTLEKIVENSKFDNISCVVNSGYPIATFAPAVHSDKELFAKRILDLIGGIVGCIISLPIILITAIPLLLESPGPLIFKQQRIGKNGRVFNIYKLRSMYADAEERKKALMDQNKMEGFMFKMDDDPRITKVGKIIRKFSIDELPQFWNVVKGDMSLVGTRPPTIDEFEKYESHHKRRLSLKPGITGLWQVSGRSDIQDFEEVVNLDCEYIDNWSLGLDIKILFKTIGVVLTHKGAE